MHTITTLEEFHSVLKQNTKVAIDFFATWCGPCKALAPHFAKWEEAYPKITFFNVDIDASEAVAEENSIESMPTIILFHNGEATKTIVGAETKRIEEALKKLAAASD